MTKRRVMMIQQGARRNYIYARQLEAAGLLHSLVTDAAWADGDAGPWARLAMRVSSRIAGAIGRRTVVGVPASRLRASFAPNLASISKSLMHEERAFALIDEVLAWPNRIRGLGGADIVVNYHGNGGSFLSYAKRQGAKIVTDFCTTPKYLEIEHRERVLWPSWDDTPETPPSMIDAYKQRTSELIALSDLYLCPSRIVATHLSEMPGFDPSRLRILPYGVSGVLVHEPRPTPGRILFAGSVKVLKGIPYLSQAATLLKSRCPGLEIVVAGDVSENNRTRMETRDLTFLGMLDRERMAEEFARADVYCHPSLVEGSATAIYEALANGLPVVTTEASGSVVQDGVEGLIVPERDAEAIADALARIVADRRLRENMSAAALAAATRYSDEACGEQFIRVIQDFAKRESS